MKKQLLIISLLAAASAAMAQTAAPVAPTVKPGVATAMPPGVRPDGLQMAKQQLVRFDANKDSKVSLKEFLAPATESFLKIDTNKDGFVTAEELDASHKRQMEEFQKARVANGGRPVPPGQLGPRPVAPLVHAAPAAPAK